MLHSLDTTTRLSVVSRRKLQQHIAGSPDRPRDADKLLRKVLLRNSLSRVDLALAEAQASSSSLSHSSPATLPSPQQQILPPHSTTGPESPATLPRPEEDDFVFPDATSLTVSQNYSTEDAEAEARWLESLLEDLSDDEDDDLHRADADDSHAGDVSFSHEEGEEVEDDEETDFDLDLLWSTNSEPQTLLVVPPPGPPQQDLSLDDLPPFYCPLPEDDDDDLSTTPGMEDDEEGESEADSVEWPSTPGHRSVTSILGRSISTSSLSQLVASAGRDNTSMGNTTLPSITEGAVYEHSVRPAIHVDEPQLYRYSPAPREQSLAASTTPALDPSC